MSKNSVQEHQSHLEITSAAPVFEPRSQDQTRNTIAAITQYYSSTQYHHQQIKFICRKMMEKAYLIK